MRLSLSPLSLVRQRGRKLSPGSAADDAPRAAVKWRDHEVNPLLRQRRGQSSPASLCPGEGSESRLERLADEGHPLEEIVSSLWHQTSDYEKELESLARGETVLSGPNWYSRTGVLTNRADHRASARSGVDALPELPSRVSRSLSLGPSIEYLVNTTDSPFSASKPRRQNFSEAKEEVQAISDYAQRLEPSWTDPPAAAPRAVRFAAPAPASSCLPPPGQLPAPQAISNQVPVSLPAPQPTWKAQVSAAASSANRSVTASTADRPGDDDKDLDALLSQVEEQSDGIINVLSSHSITLSLPLSSPRFSRSWCRFLTFRSAGRDSHPARRPAISGCLESIRNRARHAGGTRRRVQGGSREVLAGR